MATAQDKMLVLTLDDGVTETVVEDIAGGVVTRSENTRLSKLKGTVSRRPAIDTIVDVPPVNAPYNDIPTACGAIVPGPGRSNLAVFPPEVGSRRLFGTNTEPLRGTLTGTTGQNAYYPVQIDFATAVDGNPVSETPATCIDELGYQWTAGIRQTGDLTVGLFVSVHLNGAAVVSSRKVFDLSTGVAGLFGLRFFCGITLAYDNVVLWFEQSTGIYAATASLNGLGLTVGPATLICLPQNPTGAPSLYRPADVTSDGQSRAFLFTRSTANKTTVQIREVDQATLTVTNTFAVNGTVGDTGSVMADVLHLAVSYWGITDTILYAYSHNFGSEYTRFGAITRNTGTTVWHDITTGDYGPCGIQPMSVGGVIHAAIASSQQKVIFTATSCVRFVHRVLATNAPGPNDFVLYWYQLHSRGGHYVAEQVGFTETYAYWSVQPYWGTGTPFAGPGDVAYVEDPSVEIITYGATTYSPVGRIGVDRASMRVGPRNGNSFFVNLYSAVASIAYCEKRYDVATKPLSAYINQDGARICMLNLRPEHTRVTQSANGAAFVSGAMPVCWDGIEVTEAGPLHRMKVSVAATGGSGVNMTGTFFVVAVASWRDSAGNVHRSPPSQPFEITLAGTKPVVRVTQPFSYRNGVTQEHPTISLYWTLNGGSIFYQQPAIVNATWVNDPGYVQFATSFPPIVENQLYSTGAGFEPMLPACPPPAWDMQAIDGRIWLIDAEERNVVLPSLLKTDAQVTYEFNSTLRIASFDPQYGKLMAIAKYGETLIFAERCIWRVSGNGPDNSGQGQGFSDPEIVSYVGCRNRASVIQVPGIGVLFQSDDGRMALYSGQVVRFDTFGFYDVATPTIHRQQNEVIYPLTDGTGFIVYNWVKQGWTHWPTATKVINAVCTEPGVTLFAGITGESLTTRTLMFQDSTLVRMDSDTTDEGSTRSVAVERGWIAPESPQGDCVIREVWLQALSGGGKHSVTIRVSFDYDSAKFVTRTWSADEVTALTADGRYTLVVSTEANPCRAVKVLVTATPVVDESGLVGELMQPLTLSVVYGVSPGLRRATLAEGAIK